MQNSEIDLLIDSYKSNTNDEFPHDKMISLSHRNIASTLYLIENEEKLIEAEACYQCSRWWQAYDEYLKSGPKESSYLGTRVRRANGSLVMEWHNRKPAKGLGKGKYYATYIRKGMGNKYPDSTFSKEPEWAKKIGLDIELNYSALRERNKLLAKSKKYILKYLMSL